MSIGIVQSLQSWRQLGAHESKRRLLIPEVDIVERRLLERPSVGRLRLIGCFGPSLCVAVLRDIDASGNFAALKLPRLRWAKRTKLQNAARAPQFGKLM